MELPLLILFAFYNLPTVVSLKCYECANIPGQTASSCDSQSLAERECGPMFDRCITLQGTWGLPGVDVIMRNCSNSFFCQEQYSEVASACDIFNSTGWATSCSSKCCEEDLCDPYPEVTKSKIKELVPDPKPEVTEAAAKADGCSGPQLTVRKCSPELDRCSRLLRATVKFPDKSKKMKITIRDCSGSLFCSGRLQDLGACDMFQLPGYEKSCLYKCSEDEVFNASNTTTPWALPLTAKSISPTEKPIYNETTSLQTSLQCSVCGNYPGSSGVSCDSPVIPVINCDFGFDSCMTLKASVKIPEKSEKMEVTMRNCSNSLLCSGKLRDFELCDALNASGQTTSCLYKCCDKDLCDPFAIPSSPLPTVMPVNVTAVPDASHSSIQCHKCTSYPGDRQATCDSANLPVIKCGLGMDRCLRLSGTMEVLGYKTQVTMRNCSSSLVCDGKRPEFNLCDVFNVTGYATSCSVKCCEGDLCDPETSPSSPSPETAAPTETPFNETVPETSHSSIQCHECANYPGYSGAACDSPNLPAVKCGLGMDRCMTVSGTMNVLGYKTQITTRNCSNSWVCDGMLPEFNVCDAFNLTGYATSCSVKCCEGDLCDPSPETTTPTETPFNETTVPETSHSSIQCHECANYPGYLGAACDSSNLPVVKCGLGMDRCMTLSGTTEVQGYKIETTIRNCSNSWLCAGMLPEFNLCDSFNITGYATSCSVKCCEGDLCDPQTAPSSPSPETAAPTETPFNETVPETSDSSIQCHECANYPGYLGASCDSASLPVSKCGLGMDRCMTLSGTMDVLGYKTQVTMRNCSSSLLCEGKLPDFKLCDLFNITGFATTCEFKCCHGNLCDPYIVTKPDLKKGESR